MSLASSRHTLAVRRILWPIVSLMVFADFPLIAHAQSSVGLIAYWNAEGGPADVTGNGHDGVLQGNAGITTSGPNGKAFTFDGDGDYITIGDELDMGTSDFTLAAWLNGDPAMNQWARIFDKGYASGYSLHRRATFNTVGFEMFASGNGYATTTPLIDNSWRHVALVKNGTTVTIYADGYAEGTNLVSGAMQDNTLPLLIGYNPGEGTPGYWKGMLDELRIYNRSLSSSEVAGLAGVTDPNLGLVAYWNAENGAADVTGNGHDGVFQGNVATTTSGHFGKAFTFDGAGDYISIGDELDVGAGDFTLSAWIKGDPSMDQWARIFDKGYFSGYSLHRRANSNEVGFEMFASGNGFGTTTPVIDDEWHHVALVKSGTTVTIYADGDAEGTNTVSAAVQNNTLPLYIGYNPGEGLQGYWKGMLDELKIYDRALTSLEIAGLAMADAADFNHDGRVDGADLLVWQRGQSPHPHSADDLSLWKAHLGVAYSGAAAGAAPEPSCIALVGLAATVLSRGERTKRRQPRQNAG